MKQWLICIICVCAFSGLTDILIPDGKNKKAFKTVSAIALLCVFLYPLKSADNSALFRAFSFDNREASTNFQSDYDSAVISAFESGTKQALSEQLSPYGIKPGDIKVECRKTLEEITIKRITVYVDDEQAQINEKIKSTIQQCVNEETEIEITGR